MRYPRKIRGSLVTDDGEWKLWAKRLGKLPDREGLINYAIYSETGGYEMPISKREFDAKHGQLHLDRWPNEAAMRMRWRDAGGWTA
jgi:hypothetical protein